MLEADAREVLAEARAEARVRAKEILAEELTQELVERARALLRPAPSDEQGFYVYGIVRDPARELPAGTAAVTEGGLAAVTRRVGLDEYGEEALRANLNDIAWLEEAARGHESVLDELNRTTTVIPLRLCTIYRDEDAVRAMLAGERAALHDALDRLAGHTEWGVKAFCDREALEREAVELDDGAGDGEAYLARRRAEAHARERARELVSTVVEAAHARLAALAREAHVNPLQRREATGRDDDMALNGVYLVDDGAAEAFAAAVDELAASAPRGLGFELTGPWPPYNFVGRSVEAAR